MITPPTQPSIALALFGKTRRSVLAALYGHADRSFHLREIVRRSGCGMGAVQREVASLTRAGLLTRESVGNQTHYRANSSSPVFAEMKGLIAKTSGLADILREALGPLAHRLAFALVYGSIARGAETADSDVDVLVVGDITFAEAVEALGPTEAALGREVNPTVFSVAEFSAKARGGHPFLRTVLDSPTIMLVGDEDGLRGLDA